MTKRTFNTILLQQLLWNDLSETYGLVLINDDMTGTGRWSSHHRMVFQDLSDNTYWVTTYSKGLTEYQDEEPFEYEGETVECTEVFPVTKQVTVYE